MTADPNRHWNEVAMAITPRRMVGQDERGRRLTPEEQLRVGLEVLSARSQGVTWKALMTAYDLGRTRLHYLAKAAEAACTLGDGQEKCS